MKIAIDCRMIGMSGIGTVIENVACLLTEYQEHSFVLVGDPQRLHQYELQSNCTIVPCRLPIFSLKELLLFPRKEVNQCDAFFTPNFNLPLGLRVPIYSMVHDVVFFDLSFYSRLKRMVLRWYVRRALLHSRTVFTVSEFSKSRIVSYFPKACPVHVVYCAISKKLEKYADSRQESDREGIVFLGNIKTHKGLKTLLAAYEQLPKKHRRSLTIIGNIDFGTKDHEIIRQLKEMQQSVKVISGASDDEVYDLVSHAEVLVSPSLYEGFGLVPLESLYLGTPVIISDIPVHQEIYADFPVTFFRAGSAEDLCKKLKNIKYCPFDIRQQICQHYSFKDVTTPRILNEILK